MLPNQRFKTTAATALALIASAAPAASAKQLPPDPVYDAGQTAPTIVRISAPSSAGFDWGDAGIGGGLVIAQRREHRSGTSTGRRPFRVA